MTEDNVRNVGLRVAKGLTVEQSLILENELFTTNHFAQTLRRFGRFSRIYRLSQAQFVEQAVNDILAGDTRDLKRLPGLMFILERRHRAEWGRDSLVQHVHSIAGLPADQVPKLRAFAQKKLAAIAKPADQTVNVSAQVTQLQQVK